MEVCDVLVLKPERLRSKLQKQGIRGPPPKFLVSNILDVKRARAKVSNAARLGEEVITHDCPHILAFLEECGACNIPHVKHPDAVKVISTCISLALGKLSYHHKDRGPLLDQGILTSQLEDMKHGDTGVVPKGVNIWIPLMTLNYDSEIWGPDAHKFNPEMLANGVSGACKYPHPVRAFLVLGKGCVWGLNFAMTEVQNSEFSLQ
ncbi:hypothetical protein Tsubulata_044785 [Turnera subulata]|uniref:Uncharacterized protein n=1 Tax=Turnera subulata TaxID=218843 RepID=A0A9Q0G269_9ROSI|nr:hypothetical protein Tsubulata_044785 [Turnera subulata]